MLAQSSPDLLEQSVERARKLGEIERSDIQSTPIHDEGWRAVESQAMRFGNVRLHRRRILATLQTRIEFSGVQANICRVFFQVGFCQRIASARRFGGDFVVIIPKPPLFIRALDRIRRPQRFAVRICDEKMFERDLDLVRFDVRFINPTPRAGCKQQAVRSLEIGKDDKLDLRVRIAFRFSDGGDAGWRVRRRGGRLEHEQPNHTDDNQYANTNRNSPSRQSALGLLFFEFWICSARWHLDVLSRKYGCIIPKKRILSNEIVDTLLVCDIIMSVCARTCATIHRRR